MWPFKEGPVLDELLWILSTLYTASHSLSLTVLLIFYVDFFGRSILSFAHTECTYMYLIGRHNIPNSYYYSSRPHVLSPIRVLTTNCKAPPLGPYLESKLPKKKKAPSCISPLQFHHTDWILAQVKCKTCQ